MNSVPPEEFTNGQGDRCAIHPAYCIIQKSVQSGHMHMFGSRLQGTSQFDTVCLRFAPGVEYLEANGDGLRFGEDYSAAKHGKPRTYLEVTMTAAQWVQIITGQSGDGVPATIRQTAEGGVPEIAEASKTPLKAQFDKVHAAGRALRTTLAKDCGEIVHSLAEQMPESLSKRERTTILNALATILCDRPTRASSDLEYFLELVTEAGDMAVADTIIEAEAQVGAIVRRAGLDAIAMQNASVPQIAETDRE